MPITVQKRGKKFVVTDGDKTYGTHKSRKAAENQRKAIYANKSK